MAPPAAAVLPPDALPLRAEVEAGGDRARQAILLYEIGHIIEREGGGDAQAVREYLGAYNLDPSFRPPLFSLLRLFERRRSFKNLARLYEAELKSATTGEERASALIDRAALMTDQLGLGEAEPGLLEQACDEDGESSTAPLMLEWRARQTDGEGDLLATAIRLRAARTRDPVLKGVLLVELAALREASGDVDGALETLRAASRLPKERERLLAALEATARQHDRAPELVAALEGRAALLGASPERGAEVAALFLEAARLRLERLEDSGGARATLEKALALLPDDVGLLREHMLACEGAGDTAAAAADAERILGIAFPDGATGRHAAAFHFRLAEAAQIEGDGARALERLHQAAAAAPDSAAVLATVEDASFGTGDLARLVGGLRAEAARLEAAGDPDGAADALLRAASWARDVGHDLAAAQELYDAALALAADPSLASRIRRDRFTAGLELGDIAGGTGIQPLIDEALSLAETEPDASWLLRTAYHVALSTPYEQAPLRRGRARQVLEAALAHDGARLDWAADAARIFAAAHLGLIKKEDERNETAALLVRAHGMLAAQAETNDLAAAHLVAAARAAVRGGREETAIDLLKRAVQKAPSHPYAVALLEEIYRRRGDAEAVVRILREAAAGDASGRALAQQLVAAGATAEVDGDLKVAISTYREAHERDPDAEGPLLALRRLFDRGEASLADVLSRAADREERLMAAGTTVQPWASLERGEAELFGDATVAVPALRRALRAEATRVPAALALALGEDPVARLEGVRGLVEPTDAASIVLRDQLLLADAAAHADDAVPESQEDALDAEAALMARDKHDRAALLARWMRSAPGTTERAEALFALADATDDGRLAAELVLAGLRATTAAQLAGHPVEEDATLRAAEIADRAPEALEGALAYAEAFGDVDDAGERADALGRLLPLLDGSGLSAAHVASLRAEHARAMTAAGRSDEVLETLVSLTDDPSDLAAFETLRVAAREAGAYRLVVMACQRLADATEGEMRAQLLEEAAAVLMDYLEVDAEAEPLLRAALAIDPGRPIAYARLHDVLADQGNDAALLELLVARIDVTDDPEALSPLFYEEARLRRALGQREEALGALDNLFMLESDHVGGLALLVEIHVQREAWQDAVDALRRLAGADVPGGQKRIARLGAADFLEKRLGRPDEAIAELEAIEALGLADRGLYERMAAIGERAGQPERAIAALEKGAAAAADRADKAAMHRRRGALQERRDEPLLAAQAYRDALADAPLDVVAAEALARLSGQAEQQRVGAKLEEAARSALAPDPTDPTLLRTLRVAARLRGDTRLDRAVLVALVAARMADAEEAAGFLPTPPALRPGAVLSNELLGQLRLEADTGAALELADLANEALLELDRLEPGSFGVGRGELVRPGTPSSADPLVALATALGAPPAELYVGGPDPAATVGVSHRGKPLWVFGASALSAPVRARFVTAQLAVGVRLNVAPLALRLVREGLDPAIDALLATSAAAGAPLAIASGRPGVDALTARLTKVVSRRVRRAAPEVAARLGDGKAVLAYARSLRATLLRIASVLAGDVGPALDVVSGTARTDRSTRESAEARELLRFWISPAAAALAAELTLEPAR